MTGNFFMMHFKRVRNGDDEGENVEKTPRWLVWLVDKTTWHGRSLASTWPAELPTGSQFGWAGLGTVSELGWAGIVQGWEFDHGFVRFCDRKNEQQKSEFLTLILFYSERSETHLICSSHTYLFCLTSVSWQKFFPSSLAPLTAMP